MSDFFVEAIQASTEVALSEVNTAMPGKIVSFDHATNRAVVKPDMPKAIADGRDLDSPNIHEAVVAWPKGGGMLTTWPLREGDGVLLLFSQRSMEQWLDGNTSVAPDDPRRFDLSDCIVLPGLVASDVAPDPDAVQCEFDGTKVRLEPGGVSRVQGTKMFFSMAQEINMVAPDVKVNGKITQVGAYAQTGNYDVNGNVGVTGTVYSTGDQVAGAVSQKGHSHLNSGGNGVGGPPVGGGT